MIIKTADDRQRDVEALTRLLKRADLRPRQREQIEHEIRSVVAGASAEAEAAYQINFERQESRNSVVMHDLRLEIGGRVAQIDHLIAHRYNVWWVCESKSFKGGVGVNEHSEWVRYWDGHSHGIASPVEQNRRHIVVLRDVFDRGLIKVPRRLGMSLKPEFRSLVLVSGEGKIDRPRVKLAELDSVIKVDQLDGTIDRYWDEMSSRTVLTKMPKVMSYEVLEELCWQLVALHKPIEVDWAARFGLSPCQRPSRSLH